MITGEDLKEAQAEVLRDLALRELAARRTIEPPLDRAMVDAFFHMMAAPAAMWLAAVQQMHTQSRAHVAKIRRDCERRYGREP